MQEIFSTNKIDFLSICFLYMRAYVRVRRNGLLI